MGAIDTVIDPHGRRFHTHALGGTLAEYREGDAVSVARCPLNVQQADALASGRWDRSPERPDQTFQVRLIAEEDAEVEATLTVAEDGSLSMRPEIHFATVTDGRLSEVGAHRDRDLVLFGYFGWLSADSPPAHRSAA